MSKCCICGKEVNAFDSVINVNELGWAISYITICNKCDKEQGFYKKLMNGEINWKGCEYQ